MSLLLNDVTIFQGALEEPLLLAVYDRDLPRPGESIYVVPKGVQSGQVHLCVCVSGH